MHHTLQEKVTVTSTSTFSNAINSYHGVNTLYDKMINCFSMLAQSSIASNETFSYNQALHSLTGMVLHEGPFYYGAGSNRDNITVRTNRECSKKATRTFTNSYIGIRDLVP